MRSFSSNIGRVLLGLSSLSLVQPAYSLSAAEWRAQSIYQVMTDRFATTDGSTTQDCNLSEYCGGSWQGLINKLDYIKNMGFTAVWISPIIKNIADPTGHDGDSYHGYWPQDNYAVNANFGTSSDLLALSNALHAKGMYLMVDVVPNHMAYAGAADSVDYSTLNPFNNQSYFHPYCAIDSNNVTSEEQCWEGDSTTVAMPDLRTEDSRVVTMWQNWVSSIVSKYNIDGLRLDSAIEIDPAFFQPFQSSAGVYVMGEMLNGNEWQFCADQANLEGMLNYPAYFWITQAFAASGGSMSNLAYGLQVMQQQCTDTSVLGSFLENHDKPRFASLTSDTALIKNAIGFTMLADGMPVIYQGQEQQFSGGSVPNNREALWLSGYDTSSALYTYITRLNAIRSRAIAEDAAYLTFQSVPVYTDASTIAMRKGSTGTQVVGVFSNVGSSGSNSFTLQSSATGFTAGQAIIDALTCTAYTADSSGNLKVTISNGLPKVFYPTSALSGSGICGGAVTSVVSTKTSSASCVNPTAVDVQFEQNATTAGTQTIKVVGSIPQLGNWNTTKAVPLTEDKNSNCEPNWFGTVDNLKVGTVIQYKYIKVGSDGYAVWEADPNHTYTVPSGCQATDAAVVDNWQG